MSMNRKSPVKGQRCYYYSGNNSKITGTYLGKRKDNIGRWNVCTYKIIELDNGETIETILPVYVDASDTFRSGDPDAHRLG